MLARNGDMGVRWVGAGEQWRHGCVLATDGDMCVHSVGAGGQWNHGCVLGGCWQAMETWVCAGLVLVRNGDGVCVG